MDYRYFCPEDKALCYALELDDFGGFPEIPINPGLPKYQNNVSQTMTGIRLDFFNNNKTITMYTRAGGYSQEELDRLGCKGKTFPICQNPDGCKCICCVINKVIPKHPNYIRTDGGYHTVHANPVFETPDWVLDLIKVYGKNEAINILEEQAKNGS